MKKDKIMNVFCIVAAIITTMSYAISYRNEKIVFDGNDFMWVVLVAVLSMVFCKAFKNTNKRLTICSSLYAGIISFCFGLGYAASVLNFEGGRKALFVIVCKFVMTFFVALSLMIIAINKIQKRDFASKKEFKFFTGNKKSLFVVFILILLSYIPFILNYYPGSVLIDSTIQILQGQNVLELTNHHPVLHTLCIKACMDIGKGLFNNYQTGAFIYTITQTMITAFIFSFAIFYMARKKVPVIIRTFSLLFFMFCPTIEFFTITMYKDIPFALLMLLVTIGLTELTMNKENFIKSPVKILLLAITITLAMFFRNNGVYAFYLALPFFLFAMRKNIKQFIVIFIIPIVLYKVITGPVYGAFNIKQGSTKEALSVPLQQFARLMTYKSDELTEDEKEKIQQYLPIDNFDELYQSGFADPIKSNFSEEGFKQDKLGVIKLYIKLAMRFPRETIESFIAGSYGYYYPNTIGWGIYTGVDSDIIAQHSMDCYFEKSPIVEIDYLEKLNKFVNTREIPIVTMVISIGFLFWIMLACIFYNIYIKNWKYVLAFLPVLFVWVTALASPVFCEPRYVYSIFTCLPVFVGISAINGHESTEQ